MRGVGTELASYMGQHGLRTTGVRFIEEVT